MKPTSHKPYIKRDEIEMSEKHAFQIETAMKTFASSYYSCKTKVERYTEVIWYLKKRKVFFDDYLLEIRLINDDMSSMRLFDPKITSGWYLRVRFTDLENEDKKYLPPKDIINSFCRTLHVITKLPVMLMGKYGWEHFFNFA